MPVTLRSALNGISKTMPQFVNLMMQKRQFDQNALRIKQGEMRNILYQQSLAQGQERIDLQKRGMQNTEEAAIEQNRRNDAIVEKNGILLDLMDNEAKAYDVYKDNQTEENRLNFISARHKASLYSGQHYDALTETTKLKEASVKLVMDMIPMLFFDPENLKEVGKFMDIEQPNATELFRFVSDLKLDNIEAKDALNRWTATNREGLGVLVSGMESLLKDFGTPTIEEFVANLEVLYPVGFKEIQGLREGKFWKTREAEQEGIDNLMNEYYEKYRQSRASTKKVAMQEWLGTILPYLDGFGVSPGDQLDPYGLNGNVEGKRVGPKALDVNQGGQASLQKSQTPRVPRPPGQGGFFPKGGGDVFEDLRSSLEAADAVINAGVEAIRRGSGGFINQRYPTLGY